MHEWKNVLEGWRAGLEEDYVAMSEANEEVERLEKELITLRKIPVGLNTHSPNTMQLVGAALSGGDPIKLARKMKKLKGGEVDDKRERESKKG